jgi:ubiquinone/menaquinone biosynthesis C-methylase UbiE
MASPRVPVLIADAAALPIASESTDLVLAGMSLLDVDDCAGAVSEIGRVLRPGGRLCMAVVHPFASAQDVSSMHTLPRRCSRTAWLSPRSPRAATAPSRGCSRSAPTSFRASGQ